MLTEERAREKWCPMARVAEIGDGELHGPFNRYHPDGVQRIPVAPISCRCIASECMAWRWGEPAMITRRIYEGTPEADALRKARLKNPADTFFAFDGATWRYEFTSSDSRGRFDQIVRSPDEADAAPTHGYCGAFGKPGDA